MKSARLEDMVKGWFVGNFDPVIAKTDQFEVAIKYYKAGDQEAKHYHPVATEITVIVAGEARLCDKVWKQGDIILLSPGEATDFYAITDVTTAVVKFPSVVNDKVLSK